MQTLPLVVAGDRAIGDRIAASGWMVPLCWWAMLSFCCGVWFGALRLVGLV